MTKESSRRRRVKFPMVMVMVIRGWRVETMMETGAKR